jgi:hypothetical protein
MNSLQTIDSYQQYGTRAASFAWQAEADGLVVGDQNWHIALAEFDAVAGMLRIFVDDLEVVQIAWYPNPDAAFDAIQMLKTVSNSITEFFDGASAHLTVWTSILSADDRTAFLTRSRNPMLISPETLLSYRPYTDSLEDLVGLLTWTEHNLDTPTFETTGLEFPALGYSLTFASTDSTQGTPPTVSGLIASGAQVQIPALGNLRKWNATFAGWGFVAGTPLYQSGDNFTMPAEDTILYPCWTDHVVHAPGSTFLVPSHDVVLHPAWRLLPPASYSVTFDGNGATSGNVPVDEATYEEGDSVTLPGNTGTLVRPGYSFRGWKLEEGD